MSAYSFTWPVPELTEEERQYWSVYRTQGGKPGMLRRAYPLRLVNSLVAGETSFLSGAIGGSGRKTLLFALTFTGDLQYWQVQLRLATGEQITQNATTGNGFVPVTALLNLAPNSANGAPTTTQPLSNPAVFGSVAALLSPAGMPLGFDPPVILEGASQLLVDGLDALAQSENDRSVLNVVGHVWELPETPTGSALGEPPRERAPQYGSQKPGFKAVKVEAPNPRSRR